VTLISVLDAMLGDRICHERARLNPSFRDLCGDQQHEPAEFGMTCQDPCKNPGVGKLD
jgi:hypothetical protein